MQKVKCCKIEDIPEGKSIERKIIARKIVLFNESGHITAMESECRHMKAPLSLGKVEKGVVTCHWHHWKYDIKSGKCLTRDNMDLKKFETETIDGWVYVIFD